MDSQYSLCNTKLRSLYCHNLFYGQNDVHCRLADGSLSNQLKYPREEWNLKWNIVYKSVNDIFKWRCKHFRQQWKALWMREERKKRLFIICLLFIVVYVVFDASALLFNARCSQCLASSALLIISYPFITFVCRCAVHLPNFLLTLLTIIATHLHRMVLRTPTYISPKCSPLYTKRRKPFLVV